MGSRCREGTGQRRGSVKASKSFVKKEEKVFMAEIVFEIIILETELMEEINANMR